MPLLRSIALAATASSALAVPFTNDAPTGDCEPQALGHGPVPEPDTPEAFQASTLFSNTATSAVTPWGYVQAYSDQLITYNEPSQFLDYFPMETYDVERCTSMNFHPHTPPH